MVAENLDQEASSEIPERSNENVVEDSSSAVTNMVNVPTLAELKAKNESPEVLFWVGCAGAYDDRYQKVTRDFVRILSHLNISFGVLGIEESCTGGKLPWREAEFFVDHEVRPSLPKVGVVGSG